MPTPHSGPGARDRTGASPGPSRRAALRVGGALAVTAPLAACSSPLGAGLLGTRLDPGTLVFWNLFSGGDGGRMQDMEKAYVAAHGASSLQATTFAWGNPYYSKVTLATVGDKPPDVAVAHLTRAKPLWDGGLLEPITAEDLASVGLSEADFAPKAWKEQVTDGKNIAIPLDTHPFVMFYNAEVCEQAGLMDGDALVPLEGMEAFESALAAISHVTGGTAITAANVNETATPWRLFWTLYHQHRDAPPFLADDGTRISVDEGIFTDVLSRVRSWVEKGWLNRGLDYATSQTQMFTGKAGLYLQGEWEITTAQSIDGLRFGIVPVPTLYDRPAAQADSHTFVLPKKERSAEQRATAMGFIKTMLEESMTWAEGGHIPSYLPVARSAAYGKLTPQADYAAAADVAVYDDPAWYGGSGSTFEDTVGAQLALVQQGALDPAGALRAIRDQLAVYLTTPSPL